jgi:DUF4097 and DUF4098 domain-containing protein YvlB
VPSFETPGRVTLRVRLPSGNVVVETSHEPRTSVDLVPQGRGGEDRVENVVVTATEHRGGHVISVEERDRIRWGPIRITWGGDVEVRVTCPVGADLDLSGGSTDLRVDGSLGEISARTASGDIRLGTVTGELQVKTASGDVSVDALEDEGEVVTVSGDIGVGQAEKALSVRSVSGDVEVGEVRSALTVATTSGDVELRGVEAGDVRIQTISGDARVAVTPGTRVWIDAASVSGDLRSELGLSDEVRTVTADAPAPAEDEASSNVVPLHVKTVSGDVSIVRAASVSR